MVHIKGYKVAFKIQQITKYVDKNKIKGDATPLTL
jgi:hypothetical protein